MAPADVTTTALVFSGHLLSPFDRVRDGPLIRPGLIFGVCVRRDVGSLSSPLL